MRTSPTPEADAGDGMLGVVLCGGASRRMGADKAFLRFAAGVVDEKGVAAKPAGIAPGPDAPGLTWCDRACGVLEVAGLPVALSIRAERQTEYARRFPGRKLIVDDDPHVPGPLGALLSVYRATRRSLFLLAVDMPFVSSDTVALLLEHLRRETMVAGGAGESRAVYGGVCFGGDRRIDPLCAAYTAEALEMLTARAAQGLQRHDLQQLRALMNLRVLAPSAEQRDELRNVNSPEDLRDSGGAAGGPDSPGFFSGRI